VESAGHDGDNGHIFREMGRLRSSAADRSHSRHDPRHPGVGIETRASGGSDALVAVYTVAGLAPLVALAASWRWPIAAGWIGVVAGVLAAALGALDLGGILGAPPPPGMIVVDAVYAIVGVAVAWRSWGVTRRASA
jgi:hypothetical protein